MDELGLRAATAADTDTLARLFTRSRRLIDFLPAVHSATEDRDFIATVVMNENGVTIALRGGDIAGFIAIRKGWIDHLYVDPDHLRHGIGTRLLQAVMREATDLRLWTFQKNAAARAFYERHGFRPERFTDGRDNMEKEPDVLYRWTRAD